MKSFTKPEVLQRLERRRIGLFLDSFTPELREHGIYLTILHPEFMQTYIDLAAQLASTDKLPARFVEALELLETAAAPENAARIDKIFARRFPNNTGPFGNALDRVLEVWYNAPEELDRFRPTTASAANPNVAAEVMRRTSENAETNTGAETDVHSHAGDGGPSLESPSSLVIRASPLHETSSLQNPASSPQAGPEIGASSLDILSSLDISHSSLAVGVPSPRFGVASEDSPIRAPQSAIENCILNTLCATFPRFLHLPPHAAEALALWTLHTFGFDLRDVTPYLGIQSIEPGCGKTTLLNVLTELTSNALPTANISRSAFFRAIDEMRPTLLIDEADTFLPGNEGLRGVLNAGYKKKGAYVWRAVPVSSAARSRRREEADSSDPEPSTLTPQPANAPSVARHLPTYQPGNLSTSVGNLSTYQRINLSTSKTGLRQFSLWCPKAIAQIGVLPQTLADRSIIIRMQKKDTSQVCEPISALEMIAADLRDQCAKFVATHADRIAKDRPTIPDGLKHRAAEIWEPLLVLADIAGGDWPQRAREAAVALSTAPIQADPYDALIVDVQSIFEQSERDRLFSRTLVEHLNKMRNRPWSQLTRGKPINHRLLAKYLRERGIYSRAVRITAKTGRGYSVDAFAT